jgi:predicted acyl esterase
MEVAVRGLEMHEIMRRVGRTEAARTGQRLIIGPWSHTGAGSRRVGGVDFGAMAALDTKQAEIRYFDYWLKGQANGTDKDAPVRIFIMGANRWRDEQNGRPRAPRHTFCTCTAAAMRTHRTEMAASRSSLL